MKGGRIPYSDEELAWIEQHKRMIRRESHALFVEKFGRDDVSLTNYTSLCKRKGWHTGRTGRFEKGIVSWNKGKSMPGTSQLCCDALQEGIDTSEHRPALDRETRQGRIHRNESSSA